MTQPSTINGINRLLQHQKREIYSRLIPPELIERFNLNPNMVDLSGNDLFILKCPTGSSTAEVELRHEHGHSDPILYGHITDTLNGLIHVLLYMLQDPFSPRFDVDRLPDGTPTQFGTIYRNLEAEQAALEFGLAPGQTRRGLRLLSRAVLSFEVFVRSLKHDLYFAEPLYYHNAVIFEKYGFTYSKGRRLMERIQSGFTPGGDLLSKLDGSTPFRKPEAAHSVRLRSWAIHDGILGEKYTRVTMYKRIGVPVNVNTSPGCDW